MRSFWLQLEPASEWCAT